MMERGIVWQLLSNDGWNAVICNYVGEVIDDKHVVTNFELHGEFWDRSILPTSDFAEISMVTDYEVRLPQVVLSRSAIVELHDALGRWLKNRAPIDIELGGKHQGLHITIARSEDVISSEEKPLCSISYRTGRMEVHSQFVTDETCLSKMWDDVTAWLRQC